MYIYLCRCNILAQFKDIRLTIVASLFSQCDPIVTTIGSKYIWSIRLSLRSGQVSRWTGRSLDKRRANLGGHRYRGGSLEAEGRYTGIGSDRIGSTEREIEHGRSGRGLTVTDAGLALNGLTGIQPLTITIVAIIGPPRLVSRWPPFLSPSLSLSLSLSLHRPSPSLLPPHSFTLFFSTANYYRHRHSSFFQRLLPRPPPSPRLRLFKVIRGNMSKSSHHALPFRGTGQLDGRIHFNTLSWLAIAFVR